MTIPHFLWECDEVKVKQNVLQKFSIKQADNVTTVKGYKADIQKTSQEHCSSFGNLRSKNCSVTSNTNNITGQPMLLT